MSWQDAVAELAAERTRAETCVSLLKRHAGEDPAALSEGEIAYSDAKAEIDGVIAALVVALADAGEPDPIGTVEERLRRGVTVRTTFCEQTLELVPDTTGQRSVLVGVLAEAIGPLVEAAKDIYLDFREEDRLTRKTIQTQLEATRWRSFADIQS